MNIEEYHAHSAIGSSMIRAYMASPLGYYRKYVERSEADDAGRPARVGNLVHTLLLEDDQLPEEYAVYPGPVRRGKKYESFLEEHAGKVILIASELEDARQMARAIREPRSPVADFARDLLLETSGFAEVSHFWTDPETGLELKCRWDWLALTAGERFSSDLKCWNVVAGSGFERAAHQRRLGIQRALYRRGYLDKFGVEPSKDVIVAILNKSPWDVHVHLTAEEELQESDLELGMALRQLKNSMDTDEWFSEEQMEIREWRRPAWARLNGRF